MGIRRKVSRLAVLVSKKAGAVTRHEIIKVDPPSESLLHYKGTS